MMIESSSEFDRLLNLCGHAHRRIVLAVLIDQKQTVTMNDLTKMIVKENHHVPLKEVSGEELQHIKTSLHHNHIPKLANAELVEYDSARDLVKPTDELAKMESHLVAILDADPVLARPAEL